MQELETVKFYDDELVVLKQDNKKLVALKPIIENLGLDWEGQRQKIMRDAVLKEGTFKIKAPTESGVQEVTFLELRLLALYLAKINANRINKQYRAKVILYQTDCAEVLNNHFTKQPAPQQQSELQLIARLATETDKRLNTLEQGQEAITTRLDNTPIRSDGVKRATIQGKIKQYAFVLGGAPAHYQMAYRKLRPYFGITAFDDIPLRRYDEAITVIQNWIDEENYLQKQQGKLYENGQAE